MRVEDAFCTNLRRAMNTRGLRPRRLAEKADVGITTVYEARRGVTMPSLPSVWRMARALGMTVDDLLKGATE